MEPAAAAVAGGEHRGDVVGVNRPSPTSTSVPTMMRTMFHRNPLALDADHQPGRAVGDGAFADGADGVLAAVAGPGEAGEVVLARPGATRLRSSRRCPAAASGARRGRRRRPAGRARARSRTGSACCVVERMASNVSGTGSIERMSTSGGRRWLTARRSPSGGTCDLSVSK